MIANSTPELFLEHHFGQKFTGVSYDEHEYGRFGEPISIERASKGHPANGYQSDIVSAAAAAQTYSRLEQFGFKLTEHFIKVEVEGVGFTLLLTPAGVAFARGNEAFLAATEQKPLMQKSGLRKTFTKEGYDRFGETSPTDKALAYLRGIAAEAQINASWHVDGRHFTLMGLTDETCAAMQEQLHERGLAFTTVPATTDMGDMDDHGPQLQVNALSVQQLLGRHGTEHFAAR